MIRSEQPRSKSIHIGEIAVDAKPLTISTVLGSCVSACLYDPAMRIGGMNHFLLPQDESPSEPAKQTGERSTLAGRFGVQAMEIMINALMKLGVDKRRLIAKGFGGGNVVRCLSSPTAGERNVAFLKTFLEAEGIPLVGSRFGGEHALQVWFHTDTGKAYVRQVGKTALRSAIREETRAVAKSAGRTCSVTLFGSYD